MEEVEGELIVFDQASQQAHRLNRSAALVWRHCEGERSVGDLAAVLRQELKPVADEDLVWLSLDLLSAADLLEGPIQRSVEDVRVSRRHFVRRVGVVGTLALLAPVVASIAVPSPAAAQSTCSTCSTCFICTCGGCICSFCTCTF